MAKALTARGVANETKTGYYADASQVGLYLQVAQGAQGITRSWVYRYKSPTLPKRRDYGLGSLADVTLAEARSSAAAARALVRQGIDPIEKRKQERAARQKPARPKMTFEEAAHACINAKSAQWSNPKHLAQWKNTLTTYLFPAFGNKAVEEVTVDDVRASLAPIWTTKRETASRLRQRAETVFDWAIALGLRTSSNPATLKGNLAHLLPRQDRLRRRVHQPAVPFCNINAFVCQLRTQTGAAALALEFMIHTAARTGEVLGAQWTEIDIGSAVWTVPADRMKARRVHRVPLNTRALEILETMKKSSTSKYVFPGWSTKREVPLSSGALLAVMKRMDAYRRFVPHGFRSTFRDWTGERTAYASETVELALAHTIKNKTEAAYRREDQLEKRREIMSTWGAYIELPATNERNVMPLKRRGVS